MDHRDVSFSSRVDAGRQLADRLAAMGLENPLVFALPRGGVPVAVEIARRLEAPLDLILVRKIGAPGYPELAMGAIVEGNDSQVVINEDVRRMSGAELSYFERACADERSELERRRKCYIGERPRLAPSGRTVIVVDDGLATGATIKAALSALKRNRAGRIVVALPVAPTRVLEDLGGQADDIVCLHPASAFRGVGGFYRDFHQLSDEETVSLLRDCWAEQEPETAAPDVPISGSRRG
ncbi:MAG: phosphoribosyltransferase [Rhodobacteraceae bacterium]|nr:phosphoribosyltransferase [Paracoccaceae bacterium]